MGLSACFRKAKVLDKDDLNAIKQFTAELMEEDGLGRQAATTKAINAYIEQELSDYQSLHDKITERGGVIPSVTDMRAKYLPEAANNDSGPKTEEMLPEGKKSSARKAVEDLPPTDEQHELIIKYKLPGDTVFQAGHSPLTEGKFRAGDGDYGNWRDSLDEAAKNFAERNQSREDGRAANKELVEWEEKIAAKLKAGESPSIQEWKKIFPFLRDNHTYVHQPDISPFLVKYFGFSKARIRQPLGNAAGDLVSDMGNKTPIVYLGKLADVLSEKEPGATDVSEKSDEIKAAELLESLADEQDAIADDWASRKYKKSKKVVELEGDGPRNDPMISVNEINSNRKRNMINMHRDEAQIMRRIAKDLRRADQDGKPGEVITKIEGVVAIAERLDESELGAGMTLDEYRDGMIGQKALGLKPFYTGPNSPGRKIYNALKPVLESRAKQREADAKAAAEAEAKSQAERESYEAMSPEERKAYDDALFELFFNDPDVQRAFQIDDGVEETGLYSGYGDPSTLSDQRDASDSVEATSATYGSQGDLFDQAPAEAKPIQSRDNLYTQYRQVESGQIKVGITRVNSAEDAAHVFAPLRKRAQEAFYALVLDKNKKPISLIRHSEGQKASSSVDPLTVAAAIANVDGARYVWYGHNHPSGVTTPSLADIQITDKINDVLADSGVEYMGHVIVGHGRTAAHMQREGGTVDIQARAANRGGHIPVTTRELKKRAGGQRFQINGPDAVRDFAYGLESENALVLLDNKYRVEGVVHMTDSEIKALKDSKQVPRLLRAIDTTNASASVIVASDEAGATNLAKMLNNTSGGIRVLDAVIRDGDDFYFSSERGLGIESSSGIYFSRKVVQKSESTQYMESIMSSPAKIKKILSKTPGLYERVMKHRDTPWAKSTIKAAIIKDEIDRLISGDLKAADAKSLSGRVPGLIEQNGKDGVWQYLTDVGVIGAAGKPGESINSSFRNCDPSALCAKGCYAANGRAGMFPANLQKQELMEFAANDDPKRMARMISLEFKKAHPNSWRKEFLRFFDVGDISPAWVDVIGRLNKVGIGAQVFSKSPDLLSQLDNRNARMLSIDASNVEKARGNDLPLAIMYTEKADSDIINEFIDRFDEDSGAGVILPLEHKSVTLEQEAIDAIPEEVNRYVCPVNIGKWKGEMAEGACRRCQAGTGCYNNRPTAVVNFGGVGEINIEVNSIINKINNGVVKTNEQAQSTREKLLEALNALDDIEIKQDAKFGRRGLGNQGREERAQEEDTERPVHTKQNGERGERGEALQQGRVSGEVGLERSENQQDATILGNALARHFNDDSFKTAFTQNTLPDALSGLGEAYQTAFGKRLALVTADNKEHGFFDGVRIPRNPEVLYIASDSGASFVHIAGHELYHDLKSKRPDLHKWMVGHLRNHAVNMEGYRGNLNSRLKEGEKELSSDAVEEELLADITGDAMADPEFLQRLADDRPGYFRMLLAAIRGFLRRTADKLKGLNSSQYLDDVEVMRDHLKAALDAYASGKRIDEVLDGPPKFKIVWQGSPHKYDGVPDASKISTGQGAQRYGYGHYYGGAEATGRAYQQSLSPGGVVNHSIDRINDALDLEEALGKYVPSYIIDNATRRAGKMGGVDEAIAQIDELAPQLIKANNGYGDDMLLEKEVLQAYRDKIKVSDVNTGYLYKLDLDDNAIANMLDWDAPLPDTPVIRKLWRRVYDDAYQPASVDGARFYEDLTDAVGSQEGASAALRKAGIPGIKYWDGKSRAAGEGSRNYVVFPGNEHLITPISRNGEPLKGAEKKAAIDGLKASLDKPSQRDDIMFSRRQDDPVTASARRKAGLGERRTWSSRVKRHLSDLWNDIKNNRQQHLDSFRQGTLDRFHGIKLAEQRNMGNLPAEQSAYVAARLSSGISSVMRAILLHGQPEWRPNGQHLQKKQGTKGLLEILEPVADNIDDFIGWMVGNRAARLIGEGREHNFTEDEIKALQALGNGHPEFRDVARQFAEFKRSILDVAQDAGLLDPQARMVWDHADWIPFYRQMEGENDTIGPRGAGKALSGKTSGIRQLRGGESILNDPLENIIMNFHRLLDASLKNNAVIKAIEAAPDVVERASYEFEKKPIPQSEIKRKLRESGVPEDMIDMMPSSLFNGISNMWSIKPPSDPDVIRVMRNGRPQYYRVSDPLLLRAVTSFANIDFLGLDTMKAFKRILTSAVTATPEFMLRNFIRDTASTAIISRNPVAATGAFKGIVKAYKEDGGAEHMLFAGASFASGYIDGTDTESTARSVRRSLRSKGLSAADVDSFMGSVLDGAASFWDKYRHVSESIENANREATFEAAMKRDPSNVTAATFEAKDLMDFSLRGDWPAYQFMADVLPFFNARVQGLYRLGRTDPKQLAIRGAVMLTLPSLLLALGNLDNDDYEELPDWDKDTYWHFWLNGEHWRVPKPFEVGVIFGTVPERAVHAMFGEDDAKKFGKRLYWNLAEQLNLVELPQAIKPVTEVVTNYDTFGDRSIENISDQRKSPRLRYDERTSTTMREIINAMGPIADDIGLSPKKAEHLVTGYLGTFGAWGLAMTDAATRMLVDDPARPTLRPDEIPMIKVLYRGDRETPYYSTQYIQDVYDAARDYATILNDYKALMKEGKDDDAAKVLAKNRDRLTVLAPMAAAAEGVSGMNKAIDQVYRDKNLTPKQKRQKIDGYLSDRNRIASDGVKKSREEKIAIAAGQ